MRDALALLIRGRYLVDARPYNQVRGLPFQSSELADVILTEIGDLTPSDVSSLTEGSLT